MARTPPSAKSKEAGASSVAKSRAGKKAPARKAVAAKKAPARKTDQKSVAKKARKVVKKAAAKKTDRKAAPKTARKVVQKAATKGRKTKTDATSRKPASVKAGVPAVKAPAADPATERLLREERNTKIKELIKLAETQGYLTYEDINETIPESVVSADELESYLMLLRGMDIEIIESSEVDKYEKATAKAAKTARSSKLDVFDDPIRTIIYFIFQQSVSQRRRSYSLFYEQGLKAVNIPASQIFNETVNLIRCDFLVASGYDFTGLLVNYVVGDDFSSQLVWLHYKWSYSSVSKTFESRSGYFLILLDQYLGGVFEKYICGSMSAYEEFEIDFSSQTLRSNHYCLLVVKIVQNSFA